MLTGLGGISMGKKMLPPDLLFKPINELKISTRASNVLKQCDIKTFGQLYLTNEQVLAGTSNCGKVTLNEIKQVIEKELYGEEKYNCKTTVGKLRFSPRAENCLLSSGVDTLEKLINISIPNLLEIKNLGGKSTEEVILKIKELKDNIPSLMECQNNYWGVSIKEQGVKTLLGNIVIHYPIDFLPVEEEIIIILKDKGIGTIKELLLLDESDVFLELKGRLFDRIYFYCNSLMKQTAGAAYNKKVLTYSDLPQSLDYLREKVVAQDCRLWSERIFIGLSEREREMIKLYYGFMGEKKTLQEIGDKYELTRARIQQIIKKIKNRILSNIYFNNITLLMWFHTFGLIQGGVFLQEVFQKEFNTYYKDPTINTNALSEMLLDMDPIFEQVSFNVWGMTILPLDHYEGVIEEGIRLLQKGPIEQEDLLEELKQKPLYFSIKSREEYVSGVLDNFIPACLASAQSLALTNMGSYTLESREGTKVQGIINILREEGKPLHYMEILERVNAKSDNKVTVQYARAILANHKQLFARVGRGTYGLTEWGIKEYKHISDYIYEILKQHEKPLYYKQISKMVNKTHYTKEQTIYNALTQDQRFKRTKSGYYTVEK